MSASNPPESPWGLLLVGAVVGLAGACLVALPEMPAIIGAACLWVGGVMTAIGVIGVGVTMGVARAEWLRGHR